MYATANGTKNDSRILLIPAHCMLENLNTHDCPGCRRAAHPTAHEDHRGDGGQWGRSHAQEQQAGFQN